MCMFFFLLVNMIFEEIIWLITSMLHYVFDRLVDSLAITFSQLFRNDKNDPLLNIHNEQFFPSY